MATSTLRGLILVALVVLGILGLTKLFPQNTSLGVTPAASTTTGPPGGHSPSPSPSTSPSATRKARPKSKVTVQILNGTRRNGLAALITARLRDDGYKTVLPGDYSPKVAQTIIFYQSNSLPEAQRLQRQRFTAAILKPAPATLSSNIDLQVVVGQDVASSA